MTKKINTEGRTLGELDGMYAKYKQIFDLVINMDEKHMLGKIITTLGDINAARILSREAFSATIPDALEEDYWINPDKYHLEYYSKFIEEWDLERCEKALCLIEHRQPICRKAIEQRKQMLELLDL